jgi:hypothetical protein
MLHVPLPLPRSTHVIVVFGKYEPPQAILLGEVVDETHAMFLRPLGEVVCYAEVQRVVRSVGHDIYPSGHPKSSSVGRSDSWMAGTRPVMNER